MRSWVKLFVDHGELSAFGCGDGLTLACRRLWRHETAGIDSTWCTSSDLLGPLGGFLSPHCPDDLVI